MNFLGSYNENQFTHETHPSNARIKCIHEVSLAGWPAVRMHYSGMNVFYSNRQSTYMNTDGSARLLLLFHHFVVSARRIHRVSSFM